MVDLDGLDPKQKPPMTMFEKAGEALATWVVDRRGFTLGATVFAFFISALGLTQARFSTDYRIFFSKEDPGLAAFTRLESVFTQTDNVLFVVQPKTGSVFSTDALAALQELTEAGWKLPYASRVDSLTNFQLTRAEGDEISVRPLVEPPTATLDAATLAHLEQLARGEPLLYGSLLSKDGRTGAVNVTLRLPRKDPEEVTRTAAAARAVVSQVLGRHPALEIRPSGMAFVNAAFMQTTIDDMGLMIPLMVVVMLLAMAWISRSALATLSVASVILLSAAVSMATAGWLGYPLSPTSIAAPMIVLTVAVADGVHIVLAVREAMRDGKKKRAAIIDAIENSLEAVTYTWLTTIVGFLCLNYSEAPPVTHLANMTCVGVTAAYWLSITFLPALLGYLPLTAAPAAQEHRHPSMERLTDWVIAHKARVLVGAALLSIGGGALAMQLETNDQFLQYFDAKLPFRQDADFTLKNLSGIYRLEYQIGSGGPSGVADPAYLAKLEEFSGWLRAQPEVQHVYSIADILKRVHQAVSGGAAADYRLPESRAAASEELLAYEMNLPAGLDLTDRVSIDKSAARLTVTVRDMTTRQMTGFAHRSASWLKQNAPTPMWTEATGPVVIFSQLSDRNARGMIQGDFMSLALISLCMVVVLRSLKLGLVSIVPNVVPIVVGYGVWYLAVGQMNIVASIAASICLGIIVDDTIHFLTRYQAVLRRQRLSPEAAMRQTLAHVGPAMISTSVILVAGFGVLTLSSFQMTSYLGWLGVLIVGIAPVADLLIAPALVLALVRAPSPEPESAPVNFFSKAKGVS